MAGEEKTHDELVAEVQPQVAEVINKALAGDSAKAGGVGLIQEHLSDLKAAEGSAKGAGEAGDTPYVRLAAEVAARTAKDAVVAVANVVNQNVVIPIGEEIKKLQAQYPQISFEALKAKVACGSVMLGSSPASAAQPGQQPTSSATSAAPAASNSSAAATGREAPSSAAAAPPASGQAPPAAGGTPSA